MLLFEKPVLYESLVRQKVLEKLQVNSPLSGKCLHLVHSPLLKCFNCTIGTGKCLLKVNSP